MRVPDLDVLRREAVREPMAQRLEHVVCYKTVQPTPMQHLDKSIIVGRVDYAAERFCPS